MSETHADWNPTQSGFASTALQVFAGLAASAILFLLVAWTIADSPAPETKAAPANKLRYAPPPPPEIVQQSESSASNVPQAARKPLRFAEETFAFELQSLDVDFDPRQNVDTLAKLEVDISQIKMSRDDIEDMVVYDRRELDRGLQAMYQPMPNISKRSEQEHSVGLLFVVDENGKVTDEIYILDSTDPDINADVIAGVKSWTFKPPIRNKEKVRAKVRIRINISPNNFSPWGN